MNDFLPEDYEIPQKSANFMKLQDGENRIRILAAPILGWEWWVSDKDGSRKPVRVPMDETPPDSVQKNEIKHFWAFPVWNYQEERVQVLEITQKSIQKSIKTLSADPDWETPVDYDLVITRTGQKLDTEYQVSPKPTKKLDPGIQQLFVDMNIDLEALYKGEDPFQAPNATSKDTTGREKKKETGSAETDTSDAHF